MMWARQHMGKDYRRFLRHVALWGCFCLVLTLAVPPLVDPYNVFHTEAIRDNGVEPNKNYIKMKYVLSHPDRFDSFLFGSSRVAALNVQKLTGERCYNMTYSDGMPEEHLANLQSFLQHGIRPKKVYIGLDSLSYTGNALVHVLEEMRCPYEYAVQHPLRFLKLYLNPALVPPALSISVPHKNLEGFAEDFYAYGNTCFYGVETSYDWAQAVPYIGTSYHMEETLQCLSEIVSLCRENGIELVLFTNPMHHVTYTASLSQGWLIFLERLSEISPYYHFSGLNTVTMEDGNFIDNSHYRPEIGDLMLERMAGGEEPEGIGGGFGFYVTRENVQTLLALLREQQGRGFIAA